jgi:hypothetical protein
MFMTTTRQYSRLLAATLSAASGLLVSAEIPRDAGFGELIRTSAGIQRTLERCDAHPVFETALANWLENVEPASPEDRQAVRQTSLRLLQDTTDQQLVLGLIDGLLRHALEDIKMDAAISPADYARAVYTDIFRAIRGQRSKAIAVLIPAYGLQEDGTLRNERQASFIEGFLNRADPTLANRARPARQDSRREQSDATTGSKR